MHIFSIPPHRTKPPLKPFIITVLSPGIGDVSDSSTWQTLSGGVTDYLSALPLPLHHLLKYSTPVSSVDGKNEPTIVTVSANSLATVPAITVSCNNDNQMIF